MILYGKNQTINPCLVNLGNPTWYIGGFRLDLELFWFGFVVDLGLYGN